MIPDGKPDLLIGDKDHLAIWALGRLEPQADDFWEGNWLVTPIEVVAGQSRIVVDAMLRADGCACRGEE